MVRPPTRTSNSAYIIPKHSFRTQKTVVAKTVPSMKGSGVIDEANMLYQASKIKKEGSGLKLSGQGLTHSGAGVVLAGTGLKLAGDNTPSVLDLPGEMLRMSLVEKKTKPKKEKKSTITFGKPKIIASVGQDLGGPFIIGPASGQSIGSGMILDLEDSMVPNLVNVIIPKILKKLDISNIPHSLIKEVVEMAAKKSSNTLKDILLAVVKKIIPLITHSKLAGFGYGATQYKKIAKKKKFDKIKVDLAKYMHSKMMGQKGTGFWDDFLKGFLSIVKPASQILAPVAKVLLPEYKEAITEIKKFIDDA
jgi:hypothetical protein